MWSPGQFLWSSGFTCGYLKEVLCVGSDEGTCGETEGSSLVVQAVNPGDDRTLRVVVLKGIRVCVCVC